MKKSVLIIFSVFILINFSCDFDISEKPSGDPFPEPPPFDSSSIFIGIVMPEEQGRWKKDAQIMRHVAVSMGYRAQFGYGAADQGIQNGVISNLMNEGARIIIVCYVDDTSADYDDFLLLLQEAKKRRVKIIAYDKHINETDLYSYLYTIDYSDIGRQQGQAIVDALNLNDADPDEPKTLLLFAGDEYDDYAEQLFNGAMSVLQEYIADGTLEIADGKSAFAHVAVANWNPETDSRVQAALSAEVDAILAADEKIARYIIGGNTLTAVPKVIFSYLNRHPLHTILFNDQFLRGNTPAANTTVLDSVTVIQVESPPVADNDLHDYLSIIFDL